MKTYYHATDKKNIDSIISEGIKPGFDGMVYLCEIPEDACKFMLVHGYHEAAVFEVSLDENDVEESFDHSQAFFGCRAYMYKGIIDSIDEVYEATF